MSLREYIRDSYPSGIREDGFDMNSITYKYDEVRKFIFNFIEEATINSLKNLVLLTSDEIGVSEWEVFLGIMYNPSLSLEERKGIIMAMLLGGEATLTNLKNIIYSMVGGDETSVTLQEYWTIDGTTGDELFHYKVIINVGTISNELNVDLLVKVLNQVHPFHCNVFIEVLKTEEDAIGIDESIISALHDTFVWGEDGNPQATDYEWVDGNNILEGNVWK